MKVHGSERSAVHLLDVFPRTNHGTICRVPPPVKAYCESMEGGIELGMD